jgi:IclR family acetate operon transcriptional repressor
MVKTTERSLDLIDLIQRENGLHVDEIVSKFDISKSTAYKHLDTLTSRGYLTKEGEIYHIGLKFTNRGEYARIRKPAYRLAGKKVEELSKKTNEEADFVVENDGRAMSLYISYHSTNPHLNKSPDEPNKYWRQGTYYHIHCIAAGKAILSTFPQSRVVEIIESWGLPERTAQTITDPDELFSELEHIRDEGYAYSDEEYTDGLSALAMPVMGPRGDCLGSLAVNGPLFNFQESARQSELLDILTNVVDDFESELSEQPPTSSALGGEM